MATPVPGSPAPAPRSAQGRALRRVSEAVADSLRECGLAEGRLLVAVSGGVDSTVLLDALHRLQERSRGLRLAVAHVHHGLRGEAADADAQAVREAAGSRGLAYGCRRVDPRRRVEEARSSRERPSLQEAARALRYQALHGLAAELLGEGPDVAIATAHTASDQAETVLLRLLRGSGPSGLAGIPRRSADGRVVRPLLSVDRAAVEAYARARGLVWREDASNEDRHYARNRLRLDWLPGLAREFNPRLLNTLAQLADSHRRDAEWIEGLVAAEAGRRVERDPSGRQVRVALDGWSELAPALALRLWRRAWCDLGGGRHVERIHLERLQAFALDGRGGRVLELPGGLRARRLAGALLLSAQGADRAAGECGGRC
ncbi:MAG: tRNA lysidine(34) synthetase TilS [Myxococcota bacterium]